jgi:hypothetical protein
LSSNLTNDSIVRFFGMSQFHTTVSSPTTVYDDAPTAAHSAIVSTPKPALPLQDETLHDANSSINNKNTTVYTTFWNDMHAKEIVYVPPTVANTASNTIYHRPYSMGANMETTYTVPGQSQSQPKDVHLYTFPMNAHSAAAQNQTKTIYIHKMATNPEANTTSVLSVANESRLHTILVRPSKTNIATRTIYIRPVVDETQTEIIHGRPAPIQDETKTVYISAHETQSTAETMPELFETKQIQTEAVHMSISTKKLEEETVYMPQSTMKRATETVYIAPPQEANDGEPSAATASDVSGLKSGSAAMGADGAQSSSINDDFNMNYE